MKKSRQRGTGVSGALHLSTLTRYTLPPPMQDIQGQLSDFQLLHRSPVHPHHRPSQAAGSPMPGMLVGGPNSHLEDPYAQNVLAGRAPALCYADSDQSYSTNEVAVYWNSPLIALLAE